MTASELTRLYLDDSGNQVAKVFEGLPDDQADAKLTEISLSPRETLIHFAECLLAAEKSLRGEHDYAWGSYKPTVTDMASLKEHFTAERSKLVETIAAMGDDETAAKTAQAYLAGHEYYHVGQMAALRLKLTPDWDAYSIYR